MSNLYNVKYVTSKALQIIGDADNYLTVRRGRTTDPNELRSIRRWRASLKASAAKIAPLSVADITKRKPVSNMLVENLDLTQRHIQSLHETDNLMKVKLALSSLKYQVKLLADTHGAGGGNPIGWPPQ